MDVSTAEPVPDKVHELDEDRRFSAGAAAGLSIREPVNHSTEVIDEFADIVNSPPGTTLIFPVE